MNKILLLLILSLSFGCSIITRDTEDAFYTYEMNHLSFNCAFSPRDTGEDIVFNGKMWISNGYYHGNVTSRDLWSSINGVTWNMEVSDTPYDSYSEMVVYNGKIWAIKGSVWNSSDGVNWQLISSTTPFGIRSYGETVVFKNKIFQLGNGMDVWSTEDGVNWELIANQAPYGNRKNSFVTVFNGRLWLMGGYREETATPPEQAYSGFTSFNDVWVSDNGKDWSLVTLNATWTERQWSIVKVFDNKMWIIGGFSNKENRNLNDTWFSSDGVTWTEFTSGLMYTPRHEATVIPFEGSLYILAGNEHPVLNDSWRIDKVPVPIID
jgi:hypothetical protein|tara:strand:+ start:696 stop:1661 length:966 start_codon:yes stop_codon:yes gene_type:complete